MVESGGGATINSVSSKLYKDDHHVQEIFERRRTSYPIGLSSQSILRFDSTGICPVAGNFLVNRRWWGYGPYTWLWLNIMMIERYWATGRVVEVVVSFHKRTAGFPPRPTAMCDQTRLWERQTGWTRRSRGGEVDDDFTRDEHFIFAAPDCMRKAAEFNAETYAILQAQSKP